MFTPKQIAALKYLIFVAKVNPGLSKRILWLLIESSDGLTKEVCLSLVEYREGYTADEISEAAYGFDSMLSNNGIVHLPEILRAMGSEFVFSVHYGDFDTSRTSDPFNNDGQFHGLQACLVNRPGLIVEGMPLRYTFWLARQYYSRSAALVAATREMLEQIDLRNSGLYSQIEMG